MLSFVTGFARFATAHTGFVLRPYYLLILQIRDSDERK